MQGSVVGDYFARGFLYVQLADYAKAQADFEKAYNLDPAQSLSVAAQGLAAVQRNDFGDALAEVKTKLARRPDDPILLYLEADILTQQGADPGSGEFDEALQSAKKAVQLRPSLGPAHGVLAKLYLQSGEYAEAAAEFLEPGNDLAPGFLRRRQDLQGRQAAGRFVQGAEIREGAADIHADSIAHR